jgi:hypothetical protein
MATRADSKPEKRPVIVEAMRRLGAIRQSSATVKNDTRLSDSGQVEWAGYPHRRNVAIAGVPCGSTGRWRTNVEALCGCSGQTGEDCRRGDDGDYGDDG